MLNKNFDYTNKTFKLTELLPTLCCPFIFQVGDIVIVFSIHSKNRLIVKKAGSTSLHKVKKSSLNRCGGLCDD